MAGEQHIRLEIDGSVAIVTIDRRDRANALDAAMMTELGRVAAEIERLDRVRAVLLTGSGGKTFCAGGDVKAWSTLSPEDFARHWIREGHAAFDALARLRQPVIAVLNGDALGGGLELAAAADLRIAEEHARVGQPETRIGIIPGWSGTQRAVRRFGPQAVRRMALFGEILSAREALALGVVDEVVATGEGMARARALVARIGERGPLATEVSKMLINAAEGEERERVAEALAGALAASSTELQKGLAAFREKRPAKFDDESD